MKTPWIKSFWNEIQTCRNTISPLSNNSQWFIYYWRSKIALFAHLKFLTKILLVKVSSFFIMITNTVEIFWTLRKLEIWTKMGFHVPIKTQKLFMIQMILNWKAYSLIIWSIYCLMKFLLTFFLMEPGIYLQNIKKMGKTHTAQDCPKIWFVEYSSNLFLNTPRLVLKWWFGFTFLLQ